MWVAPGLVTILDPAGCQRVAFAVQHNARDQSAGDDREIGTGLRRSLQIGVIGARPGSLAGIGLMRRGNARGVETVAAVVVAARDAGRLSGDNKLSGCGKHGRPHRDADRTATSVRILIDCDLVAGNKILHSFERGEHVVIAPTVRAEFRPMVEILRMPANSNHVVDA
jgi:hypothetical protein